MSRVHGPDEILFQDSVRQPLTLYYELSNWQFRWPIVSLILTLIFPILAIELSECPKIGVNWGPIGQSVKNWFVFNGLACSKYGRMAHRG